MSLTYNQTKWLAITPKGIVLFDHLHRLGRSEIKIQERSHVPSLPCGAVHLRPHDCHRYLPIDLADTGWHRRRLEGIRNAANMRGAGILPAIDNNGPTVQRLSVPLLFADGYLWLVGTEVKTNEDMGSRRHRCLRCRNGSGWYPPDVV